jgi:GxxExxY protein
MNENELSFKIRGCIFKVYNSLGQVFSEVRLDLGFRADIIVEDMVLLEIKSVENIAEVHHKQVLTYLKLTGLKLGILVNFNTDDISGSIFRKVNGL